MAELLSFSAPIRRRRDCPPRPCWRREWDSNPRGAAPQHALQACALNRSAIPPSARDHTQAAFPRQRSSRQAIYGAADPGTKLASGGTEPWPGEVPDPGFPSTSASSPVRELAIRAPDLSSESTAPGRPTIDAVAGLSVTKPWAEDAGPSRPSALRRPARPAFSLPAPGSVSSAPGRPWAGTGAARRSCSSPRCAPPRFARTA
jgi:hypothetical protein